MKNKSWILLSLFFFNGKIPDQSLTGRYRLAYYPEIKKHSGWDLDGVWLEELLILGKDSTYRLERIHPQGGFEVIPQTGRWRTDKTKIFLLPDTGFPPHTFHLSGKGLTEPNAIRKDLRKVTWEKEN